MDTVLAWFVSNLTWAIFWVVARKLVMSFLISAPIWALLRNSFGVIKTKEQSVWFWMCAPMAIFFLLLVSSSIPPFSPNFSGTIETMLSAPVNAADPKSGANIILVVTVRNQGSTQSALTGWDLSVEIDGTSHPALRGGLPEAGMTVPLADGHSMFYPSEDSMRDRSMTPIPSGGIVQGVLFFVVPDLTAEIITSHVAKLTLTFNDAALTEYKIIGNSRYGVAPMLAFPGIKQQYK